MKNFVTSLVVASAHIAFLFIAYGTHFFGLSIPGAVATAVWLGGSSVLAAIGYYYASAATGSGRSVTLALVAAGASLYVGTFLAINMFGS